MTSKENKWFYSASFYKLCKSTIIRQTKIFIESFLPLKIHPSILSMGAFAYTLCAHMCVFVDGFSS